MRINHPLKWRWDVLYPALAAGSITASIYAFPKVDNVFGTSAGYLDGLGKILVILAGFYITSLTLVATAQSEMLEKSVSGHPKVTLGKSELALTRRRFLSYLFGYLSFSSFCLVIIGYAAILLAPGIKAATKEEWHTAAQVSFLLVYNLWVCHVLFATLVGLYYFSERLAKPDSEVIRD